MKDWISKFRAKRAKVRQKRGRAAGRNGLPVPLVSLFLGLVAWFSVFVLVEPVFATAGAPASPGIRSFGDGLLLLIGLLVCTLVMQLTRPVYLKESRHVLLLLLVSLFSLLPAKALLYASASLPALSRATAIALIPYALAPLLTAILVDAQTALVVGTWVTLGIAVVAGRDFAVLFTGLVATVVTARIATRVRRRIALFRIGLTIGLWQALCTLPVGILQPGPHQLYQIAACLASGIASALVVLLVLPLLEALFSITTDITLLELSDLGHPLLQRLAIEAPGTYHHSLVVANLAQAAADEIGANSLQARVCSYFHDIGKLTKPEFYAENIRFMPNPHDDLAPSMSTLVITAHVKEGIGLARLSKLPPPVLDAIRTHHGTGLVSFFHQKARAQRDRETREPNGGSAPTKLNEGDFRYPGPKPASREAAIIALADAVEAASRSMEKHTPGHIEDLVNAITSAKVDDGQLDAANMTFAELSRVKRSFVFTLTNMLHGRVSYPESHED